MITKTEGIVLRVSPFSKTSHIVTWLTRDHGKVSTVVKGAMRPKSMFLGQYDLFYTCELLFYTRERNELHTIKECSPLDMRKGFRTNWCSAGYASYICDLISRLGTKGSHEPELYILLSSALDFLCENGTKSAFIFWFELQLLGVLGLSPQTGSCARCKKPHTGNKRALFSPEHGGIVCTGCSDSLLNMPEAIEISPDVIAILKKLQKADKPGFIKNIKCTDNQMLAFRKVLGVFLAFHLEIMLKSRQIALRMAA